MYPSTTRSLKFAGVRVAQYFILFLVVLIVARALGPAGRAQYALPLALSSVSWIVLHLSLDTAAIRMFARGEISMITAGRIQFTGAMALGSIGFAATFAIGWVFRDELLERASVTAVLLASATVPCWLAIQAASSMLLLTGNLRAYGLSHSFGAVVQLTAVVTLHAGVGLTPENAVAATLAGLLATAVVLAVHVSRLVASTAIVPTLDRPTLRRALGLGLRFHLVAIGFAVNVHVDLLIAGALVSAREAGLLSLAMTLAQSAFLASTAFAQAGLSTQMTWPLDRAREYTITLARRCSFLSWLAIALAGVAAYPAIVWIFGSEWRGAVLPFAILLLALVPMSVWVPVSTFLVREGSLLALSGVAAAGAVINAGLDVAFVFPLGIAGIAVATLIASWCFAAGGVYMFSRLTRRSVMHLFAPSLGRTRDITTDSTG
jgi:O-antigen/teichoic acid export membrane protein